MGPAHDSLFVAIVFLLVFGLLTYRAIVWVIQAQPTADPWDAETGQALESDEARPLCHHCFTPQDHNGWFCPNCGATVGQYVNYLPYVYLFSQGEVLRAGVAEHLRRSPLIVCGYILLSLAFFPILAPVYWFFFVQNLLSHKRLAVEETRVDAP
ncbi:MAG TPA: hypothetical protein VFE51_24685 [Verrucomicrobiae bacterium]|nr:hypothetical protein [Verrucomicrobiae bacterium]